MNIFQGCEKQAVWSQRGRARCELNSAAIRCLEVSRLKRDLAGSTDVSLANEALETEHCFLSALKSSFVLMSDKNDQI